jgi:hypothetical protein
MGQLYAVVGIPFIEKVPSDFIECSKYADGNPVFFNGRPYKNSGSSVNLICLGRCFMEWLILIMRGHANANG